MEEFFKSKYFKWSIIFLGGLIIILAAFNAGKFIGFRKASFFCQWGENYPKNFSGPRPDFNKMMDRDRGFLPPMPPMNPHGTAGTILKIEGNSIATKGADNIEKTVITDDKTTILKNREKIKVTDLKVDDQIMVIGNPNSSGQIEAKLIRIFDKNKN